MTSCGTVKCGPFRLVGTVYRPLSYTLTLLGHAHVHVCVCTHVRVYVCVLEARVLAKVPTWQMLTEIITFRSSQTKDL